MAKPLREMRDTCFTLGGVRTEEVVVGRYKMRRKYRKVCGASLQSQMNERRTGTCVTVTQPADRSQCPPPACQEEEICWSFPEKTPFLPFSPFTAKCEPLMAPVQVAFF